MNTILLTNEEQTAMLVFIRTPRFIEGYNPKEDLEELLLDFKNMIELERNGLVKTYKRLKQKIIQENKIGLIIYGLTLSDSENTFLGVYQTNKDIKINLSLKLICYYLRKDYLTKEEIRSLCFKTPLFDIYYNNFDF